MNQQQVATQTSVLLLVVALPSYGQEASSRIAAAKAAAALEARAQGPVLLPPAASTGTFTTFDVPGAGTGAYQGTLAAAINPTGAITGSYVDANRVTHGFVRKPDGSTTTFDPIGSTFTGPTAIDPLGVITGSYCDTVTCHGFVRAASGALTTFDAPGSFTAPSAINRNGAVTGSYQDASGGLRGFLRLADGTINKIDVPGAAKGFGFMGTNPADINTAGAIVGSYVGASDLESHGFLRTNRGTFVKFDPPPRGYIPLFGTIYGFGTGFYINASGAIAGTYFEYIPGNPFGGDYRVFVRTPDGFFLTFDAATYGPCCIWSFPSGLNSKGVIVGYVNDGYNIFHGFVRTPDASTTIIDAPGAGTGFDQGTVPVGITPASLITGFYRDTNNVSHGFILSP